jgi:uncharacterized protein HemX
MRFFMASSPGDRTKADLSNDLSMSPSKDDLAMRQSPTKSRQKQPKTTEAVAPSRGLYIVIGLLLVALAGAGIFGYQAISTLQQQLQLAQNQLNQSASQLGSELGNLKNKVTDQTTSLGAEGNKMSAELQRLDSEIRKTNDRTRKALEANQSAIEKLQTTSDEQKKLIAAAQTLAESADKKVAEMAAKLDKSNADSASDLRAMRADLAAMSKRLVVLDEVENNTQAIRAIDAHRRQLNAAIDQIRGDISVLYQKTGATPGARPGAQ